MKEIISNKFLEFMERPKAHLLKSCKCSNDAPYVIKEYYINRILCDLFNQSANYLQREFEIKYIFLKYDGATNKPFYYLALVNNSQLHSTNMIPDCGNCSLCVFSFFLRSN